MITAYKTDVGLVRSLNEDRVVVQNDLHGFTVAIVADGMGGHQAGDIASQMAIEAIQLELGKLHKEMSKAQCRQLMKQSVEAANHSIYEAASQHKQYEGMGTTIVVAVADREQVLVANVGDSRAYIVRKQSIEQLTEDHSLVTELVKKGEISLDEAGVHPRRNILTRALGTEPTVTIDLHTVDWTEGDLLLLCSDGLSGLLSDESLLEILRLENSIEEKAEKLVSTALAAGGEDNITVALLENGDVETT